MSAILCTYFDLMQPNLHRFQNQEQHNNEYEKKVKQWWSTIPSISTKRTATSYLNSLSIKTNTTYDDGSPRTGTQKWRELNRLLLSQIHYKQTIKKNFTDFLPL